MARRERRTRVKERPVIGAPTARDFASGVNPTGAPVAAISVSSVRSRMLTQSSGAATTNTSP